MNRGTCCPKCFENIAHVSPSAAKLWIDMCEFKSFSGRDPVIKDKYHGNALIWLENYRYIISTDNDKRIIVKLNGLNKDESGEDLYCMEIEKHAE